MTGFLRDYLVYVFVFFIVIIGGSLAVTGGFSYDVKGNASIGVYEPRSVSRNDCRNLYHRFCKVKTDGDYRTRRHRLHARAVLCHFQGAGSRADAADHRNHFSRIVPAVLLSFAEGSDLSRNRLGSGSQMRLYRSASELL